METIVYQIDPENINQNLMKKAAQVIKTGGIVAFPTETVYGLGANALNTEAAAKIYAAKGRPSDNPLIAHVAEVETLYQLCSAVPEKALQLAGKFWPGPLTMVLPKSELVPEGTTGGLGTVAVRMPDHPIALALIRESKTSIAAPSANVSGRPSPTLAEHVLEDMNGRIEMVLDGGPVGIGIESTIIDLTDDIPVVLRPGFITLDMLKAVVGEVTVDPAVLNSHISGQISADIRPKAPGMKYRHYAPKGTMTIYEGESHKVIEMINSEIQKYEKQGFRTGVIATDESLPYYKSEGKISIGSRNDQETVLHNLYDALRKMDEMNVQYIFSESFPEGIHGFSIMNRLMKAAGYHIIYI